MKFEENRMVRTIQYFELFDKKWLTIFDKVCDDILEDVPVIETIVDAKLLNQRVSSFSIPKITKVQHV